ncbi:MAG: SRPBCC family protein [Alphaproteobacteria bacterium]
MRLLRGVILTLVFGAALAAVVGLFLPSTVSVSRFVIVNAPKAKVFATIDSLRAFSRWSPWTERDPAIKFRFDGPDSGVGQKMHWESAQKNVGSGSMEITDSLTNEKLVMSIVFGGQGHAGSSLALEDFAGGGTKVTWSFSYTVGANPFARYVGLIMPSVIGDEYAHGLSRLKSYVETIPKVDISDLQVSRVSLAPRTLISASETAINTPEGMTHALAAAYKVLAAAMKSTKLAPDGAPISVAESVKNNDVTIECSFPVKDLPKDLALPQGVHGGKLAEGEALSVAYKGDLAGLQTTYVKLLAYALTKGWKVRGSSWNEYLADPAASAQLDINIYLPVE